MIVTVFFFFFSLPLYVPTFEKVDKEKKNSGSCLAEQKKYYRSYSLFFFFLWCMQ